MASSLSNLCCSSASITKIPSSNSCGYNNYRAISSLHRPLSNNNNNISSSKICAKFERFEGEEAAPLESSSSTLVEQEEDEEFDDEQEQEEEDDR